MESFNSIIDAIRNSRRIILHTKHGTFQDYDFISAQILSGSGSIIQQVVLEHGIHRYTIPATDITSIKVV